MTDDTAIIAWTRKWVKNPRIRTGSEISGEDGIFRSACAAITYRAEDPAVQCAGDQIPLPMVKIATPHQRNHYLQTLAALDAVRKQLKAAEQDIAENGLPVTWEWILQHGKPREGDYVPVPYHSKAALATLRKGSKVVIAVQSSEYYRIAGKVGKIVKKRSKDALVRFGEHQYRIPYSALKPAHQVSQEARKRAREGSESAARVVRQISQVFSGTRESKRSVRKA